MSGNRRRIYEVGSKFGCAGMGWDGAEIVVVPPFMFSVQCMRLPVIVYGDFYSKGPSSY